MTLSLALLAILFVPSIFGGQAQWLKLLLLSLAVCLCRRRFVDMVKGGGIVVWLGVGWLACALVGALLSAQDWQLAFLGSFQRPEGWFALVVVFSFCVEYWSERYDAQPESGPGPRERHVWTVQAVVVGLFALWIGGDDLLQLSIATKLGMGTLCSIALPILVGYACRRPGWTWIPVGMAAYLLSVSGCRSGWLGATFGVALAVIPWGQPCPPRRILDRWWGRGVVLAVIIGAMLCSFDMRNRLAKVGLPSGGPRAQLAAAFIQSGTPLFGWGPEQQRFLIDRVDGELGLYDRFHLWPLDAISTAGYLGFALILVALILAGRRAWQARWSGPHRALAGSFLAFMVAGLWNPPCPQTMLLGGTAFFGLFVSDAAFKKRQTVAVPRGTLRAAAVVACLVFASLTAGDWINCQAKLAWNGNHNPNSKRVPHRLLGLQWIASELNPWVRPAYYLNYCGLSEQRNIIEPLGMKWMLLEMYDAKGARPRSRQFDEMMKKQKGEKQ